jgi:hypothetical protein
MICGWVRDQEMTKTISMDGKREGEHGRALLIGGESDG